MKKLVILLLCVLLLSSCERRPTLEEQYEELKSDYYRIEEEYSNYYVKYIELKADIASVYDEAIMLKAYFLKWDDATFDDAKKSIKAIYDRLYPGEW